MMTVKSEVSQRLVRKGALAPETYALFSQWDAAKSFEDNLKTGVSGSFGTISWSNEIIATLRRRFRDRDEAAVLVGLARGGLPFEEWRSCLLLWIGMRETLFHQFVSGWLYPEYQAGRYAVRVDDVIPYVKSIWPQLGGAVDQLSDYGLTRTSRDLIRMATDLGLLAGTGSVRRYAGCHLSDRCFIYWLHSIYERERTAAAAIASPLWQLALLRPEDIHRELLRLHQFRKVEYEVAGSLVQLTLSQSSSRAFAEVMMDE
jgi:hypothetical protein